VLTCNNPEDGGSLVDIVSVGTELFRSSLFPSLTKYTKIKAICQAIGRHCRDYKAISYVKPGERGKLVAVCR